MPRSSLLKFFLLLVLSHTPARAHHGQDFLLLQDYPVPLVGRGAVYSGFDWSRYGSVNESGVESGAMIGIAPRLALGTNVEFSDAQGGWGYSSVTPYLRLQLTPPGSKFPLRVGLQVGYQFAETQDPERVRVKVITPGRPIKQPAANTRTIAVNNPEDTGGGGNGGGEDPQICGPEFGPDAPLCPEPKSSVLRRLFVPQDKGRRRHSEHTGGPPPTPTTPTSTTQVNSDSMLLGPSTTSFLYVTPETTPATGIHRHGENFLNVRLIVEADITPRDRLLLNFINITPASGKPAWGYAGGWRHSFNHDWATGIEAVGDIGNANEHEVVLGGYFSPRHDVIMKLGVGVGLTGQSADVSLRTGIVWRF